MFAATIEYSGAFCLTALSNLSPATATDAATPSPSPAPIARISEDMRRLEYAFRPLAHEAGVSSAPNRSQGLRSRISAAGLEVFPRETSADGIKAPWKLVLRTRSFSRRDDVRELDAASISTAGNRVEFDLGALREWIVNDERGIEQGYSIDVRPSGSGALWIGLAISGDLSLRIDDGARSAALVDACGETRMRYRDLSVFDATGRELPARLSSSPSGVGIEIDDARAVYPLTVDPRLTGPAWTAESDQAGAQFATSVATAGDVNGDGYSDVIVGAPYYDNGQLDEGRAFVYLGSSSGLAASAAWTAESDQINAQFGYSVATAGDVNGDGYSDVIVGAYFYSNGQSNEGRAYVYMGSSSGLAAGAAWTAESDQTVAVFGCSVATAGDVNGDGYSDVIVGAYNANGGESGEGRAYVYLGSSTGLAASAAWTAESDQVGASFGYSVSAAGDVNGDGYGDVVVGAPNYDDGQTDEGRTFVYLGSSTGLVASPAWTAESDQAGANFGWSAATAGDVNGDGYGDVIVGARFYDGGQTDEGRAYLYLGAGGGLSASAAWTAESDQANAYFGWCVATAGDVNGDGKCDVVVGADQYDDGETNEGRAYVYLGTSTGLASTAAWTAESDLSFSFFGHSVATAGDVNGDGRSDVIVGAYRDANGQSDEGRAFVYSGSSAGLAGSAVWMDESNQAFASFGASVATAGDVNGDGYSDVIVGAPDYDDGQTNEGRAFVYLGSSSGLATSASWTAESDQAFAEFGISVATAGDVNGDGYSDVIIGANAYSNGQSNEGRAFVYLGSSTGLAASAAWTAESDQASAGFGQSVATAGDVNGDGYSDVIVSAPRYDNVEDAEGRVFVYLGSSTGLAASAAWTAESNQASALFGESVATAGDVNGDGYSDVIVGARNYDNGQTDEGGAFVYLGSSTGLAASPGWTAESNQASAFFGTSVATAGDVNGDGFSDVIVGAPNYDSPEAQEGRVFVYLGSATGLATSASWTAESDLAGATMGNSVATAGDVNGDGYSDVIVGADSYSNGQSNEGRASVYLGSSTGLASTAAWTAESDQAVALFGWCVATAGDVDGDGHSDVVVGAVWYDNGQTDEGRALVYLGNEGRGGWTLAAQQRQQNDARAIDLLGRSTSNERFRIRLALAHQLAGFEWATSVPSTARLQWEVAPLRSALDGNAIASGTEESITASPLAFDEPADFDASAGTPVWHGTAHHLARGPYHWRARVRTSNPVFPVTRWVSMPWNNVTETKLSVRTPTFAQPQ